MKKTMKTLTVALLVLAMLSGALAMTASAAEEGYSGTPATPQTITSENYALFNFTDDNWSQYDGYYAITTAEELYGWASLKTSLKGNAVLINDIVVNTGDMVAAGDSGTAPDYTWTPIENFEGIFDGRGYSISGLYVNTGIAGVFYSLSGSGVIRNLTITNSYISGSQQAGGLVWSAEDGTVIENCVIGATVKVVSSSDFLGGIVSQPESATLKNCVVLGTVYSNSSSSRYVGAIVGNRKDPMEVTCTNCYYISGNATNADGKTFSAMGYNQTSNDYTGQAEGIASVAATHTCIGMEHPEVSGSCYVEGSTAYSDCMVCGKILTGEKTATGAIHRWKDATCTAPKTCLLCEQTEGEKNPDNHTADPTFSINADNAEQHNKTYTDCCGVAVTEAHSLNTEGTCTAGCGAQAAAKVGNDYYVSVDNAIAAAKTTNATVTLLADDVIINTVISSGTFTLDLNGHTLKPADGMTYVVYMQSGHLTIQDSAGGGAVIKNSEGNDKISAYGGNITILSGSFNNVMCQHSDSELLIYGGYIDYLWCISGEVSLYGGEFVEVTGNGDKVFNFLSTDGFYYDENDALVTDVDATKLENVTVKQGADLSNATVTVNGDYPYIGTEIKPTDLTVTILGKTIDSSNYTLSYANNVDVGTATVTVTGKGDYTGTQTANFAITKGTLRVAVNPETTYEYGDTYEGKELTGGKVVIVGNDTAVITGTWAWVEGTDTAAFTPDAQYIDLFETFTETVVVTQKVTAATPALTLTSPSPSVGPGQTIRMSVVAVNPNNAELTDLPTAFKVTYKVGENGTETTVDGLEFTLPSDVTLGETLYVWVKNVAVDGKYAVGTSNTIELLVGQVDYSTQIAELQAAIAALEEAHGADVSDLQDALDALVAQLAALDENGYATDAELAAAKQELQDAITALTQRVTTLETTYATIEDLKAVEQALQEAIDANTGDIADLTAELTEKYNELIALIGELPEGVDSMREYVDSVLEEAQTTLQEAIDKVAADLADAEQALQEAIDANSDDIADLTAELTEKYNELIALIGELPEGVDSMREYVDSVLEEAQTTLQDAIDKVAADLADAEQALQEAIDANSDDIADLTAELTEKYNELIALIGELPEGVDSMREYVDSVLEEAQTTLQEAIDQVQANLEAAQEQLQEAIDTKANAEEMAEALNALTEAIKAAEAAAKAGDEALRSELAAARASLNASINAVAQDLAAAKESLAAAIAAGDAALDEKIAALNTALENVSAAYKAADRSLKSSLTTMIQEAETTLQEAIDKVASDLAAAQQALNAAIAAGDKDLDDKIAALNTALENAIAASNAADEALSAEMKQAVATLEKAIAQVQKNLDAAKAELAAKDEELMAKDAQLNTMVIVAIVIASTALCGCGVLVWFVFIGKRKLI